MFDNIFIERLWLTLNYEHIYLSDYTTGLDPLAGLTTYFDFYNHERFHQSLDLVRQWEMLIRYRATHIQHMQKALQQMNLKLTNVVSDITGVTGLAIIQAILQGERDPIS